MIFKTINWQALGRVLLLTTNLVLIAYCIFRTNLLYLTIALILIFIAQVIELTRYITKTERELARFLLAIKSKDYSQHFNTSNRKHLHQAFNEIIESFKELRNQKEAQYHYLQSILELVQTGIIVYDQNGKILLCNQAFRNMLQFQHISQFQTLQKKYPSLYQLINNLQPGNSEVLKIEINQQPVQILVAKAALKLQNADLQLISLQNVSTALNEAETASWQKLLRVLTHEIMNSVAPIASLSTSMSKRFENMETDENLMELLEDTALSINVIRKRSEGLLKFADSYRSLNKVDNIQLSEVSVKEIFDQVQHLMGKDLQQAGISFQINLKTPGLTLKADSRLLEQVIINLILNAKHAVVQKQNPIIKLTAKLNEHNNRVNIEVADNGTGIEPELLENIFIPFFTTRKEGSGIGLSLSRQIMQLHQGTISVHSEVGVGTIFILHF